MNLCEHVTVARWSIQPRHDPANLHLTLVQSQRDALLEDRAAVRYSPAPALSRFHASSVLKLSQCTPLVCTVHVFAPVSPL